MRSFYFFLFLFASAFASAQNPSIVKAVGSTVLQPKDKDQEIWQNNEWNGKFFYQGTGTPLKLCVTDGTAAGTQHIKDINADYFQFTCPAQNFIYIITERSSGAYPNLLNNVEIWKSDGTAAGTTLVKALPPFNPFNFSSGVSWTSDKNLRFNYSVIGDVMYFVGWDATNGKEVWRTDGTDAGTYMVKDIRPGTASPNPSSFCALGSDVYFFAAAVGLEQKLWKTDGTAAGTVQVPVPEPFFAVPYVGKAGNKMIFFANNTVNGIEPWVSDGTPSGTFMLADINPGSGNSTPSSEQNLHLRFNDKYCFFIANKTSGGKSLWRTDGTQAGTIQLTPDGLITEENFSGGGYSDINDNFLYWIGGNQKLYRSDGTVAGTTRITTALSNALYLKIYKNAAWFHARNADNLTNGEPFRSDGTAANTKRLEVQPGEASSYPYGFFVTNNHLYFFGNSNPGTQLYQYNGDMTFNGSLPGGRWGDNGNWNSMLTPGITDTVFINSGFTVNVDGGNAFAGSLQMQAGSTANLVAATDSLFVHKELKGTSTSGNGILVLRSFTGDTVRITNAITAANVNAAGAVSLGNQLTISNNLNLTGNARLLLNQSSLRVIGSASTITNAANSYIVTNSTGSVTVESLGSGGRAGAFVYPVGTLSNYNPVSLTNIGTADAFSVRVQPGIRNSYTGETPTGGTYTGGAVNATWFINEEIAGGSNATIGLQWDAAQELPGFDRSQSRIGHYIGGSWQLASAGAAAGSNPYNWIGSGYTSFSPFGVLNSNATLPLLKITFNVVSVPAGNQCTWMVTGGDIESIVLQRSLNGRDFVDVHSAAFSLSDNFTDAIRNATKTFYRLKIIDKNASVKYSNIVWLDSRLVSNPQLYPTLFTQSFFVQYQGYGKALIKIYNESGSMVQQNQLKEGTNEINAARLPSGAYFYQIVKEQNVLTNGQVFKQ